MKTRKNFFRVLLPTVAALLLCTACGSDDNYGVTEEPVPAAEEELTAQVIPYTATVGGDVTRATLDDNGKYVFESGDKLYVTGTNISGTLTLKSGAGEAQATFSGNLEYTGSGTPSSSLTLSATLYNNKNDVVTMSYGKVIGTDYSSAFGKTLAEAVQKCSHLTGTSTYGNHAFTLYQQSAFITYTLTFNNGTALGDNVSVEISSGGSVVSSKSAVTQTETSDGKIVATFVAAFAGGTTLTSPTLTVKPRSSKWGTMLNFGSATLTANKNYKVAKSVDYKGLVIGSDGNFYDAGSVPSGVKAVAIVAYAGSPGSADASSSTYTGLAIAMNDATRGYWTTGTSYRFQCTSQISSDASISLMDGINCTNMLIADTHTHAAANNARNYKPSGATSFSPTTYGFSDWFLPSTGQWNLILKSAIGTTANISTAVNSTFNYNAISAVIVAAGGTALASSNNYWTSTEASTSQAWVYMQSSTGGYFGKNTKNNREREVRPVIAF